MIINDLNWTVYDKRAAPKTSKECKHPLDSAAHSIYTVLPKVHPSEEWQLGFICFDSYVITATRKMGKHGWGKWRSHLWHKLNPVQELNHCEACGRPGSRLTVRRRQTPLGLDPGKPQRKGWWKSRKGDYYSLKFVLCKWCHQNAKSDLKQIERLQLLNESIKDLNKEIYRVKKDRNNRAAA